MQNNIEFIEETHTYLVDGVIVPCVSDILEPISSSHYRDIDEEILRLACMRGSMIHKATELIDNKESYEIEDKWKGYVLQYKKFLAIKKPEILYMEQQLTNGEFCGTLDRIYLINGVRWLVDIKTSSVINTDLVEPQLGGYATLLKYNNIEYDKCAVLHLSKNKYEFREVEPNEYIFNILLEIWKYNNRRR